MAETKKRKYQYSDNGKKRKRFALEVGLKGFLCSCNDREKDCVRESYNILNEYAPSLEPEGQGSSEVNDKEDVDELEREIQALKTLKEKSNHRFQAVESGAKNIVFIRTTLEDPVKLAQTIIEDIHKTRQQKTRFLIRLVPIEETCKAYLDDIKKAIAPLVQKYFGGNEPKTFSVFYNHRHNNQLSRDDVITAVADMVTEQNKEHKVDLKNGELSVIIEVIKNYALLSVTPKFLQYKKYNLHMICKD
ncbi:hypothetical protein PPYR_11109 [Photinus pyralis]|uniref:THUMP domain-containing protein n=1 Tax=Photinus pyralis TaxID=7054 RepID=A0A1Y1KZB2_PHOPY|nr:hypothetical protein PPYR_11109 [Photinus pyralis]